MDNSSMWSLVDDIRREIRNAQKLRLSRWGLLSWMGLCLLILLLFDHLGRPELFLPTMESLVVVGLPIWLRWELSRHLWFWVTMTVIAALHVALIAFVPWTERWIPAIVAAAVGSADVCVILAIVVVGGRIMGGRSHQR
jgi:hypothetical protein